MKKKKVKSNVWKFMESNGKIASVLVILLVNKKFKNDYIDNLPCFENPKASGEIESLLSDITARRLSYFHKCFPFEVG